MAGDPLSEIRFRDMRPVPGLGRGPWGSPPLVGRRPDIGDAGGHPRRPGGDSLALIAAPTAPHEEAGGGAPQADRSG